MKGFKEKCLGQKKKCLCRTENERYDPDFALKLYKENMSRGCIEILLALILDR